MAWPTVGPTAGRTPVFGGWAWPPRSWWCPRCRSQGRRLSVWWMDDVEVDGIPFNLFANDQSVQEYQAYFVGSSCGQVDQTVWTQRKLHPTWWQLWTYPVQTRSIFLVIGSLALERVTNLLLNRITTLTAEVLAPACACDPKNTNIRYWQARLGSNIVYRSMISPSLALFHKHEQTLIGMSPLTLYSCCN